MMRFLLLFSRQGKLRLQKWFLPLAEREKKKIIRDMTTMVLARKPRTCNFLHWRDLKIVYKRYASLYFCCGLEDQDNELLALEVLHRYVELLDKYFGNVCELDIIFNFEKAYFILDEFLMGGEIQETSKQSIAKSIEASDMLQEVYLKQKKIQTAENLSKEHSTCFLATPIGLRLHGLARCFTIHILFYLDTRKG
ncbi:AP-1 complex subunit sigma-3b isoform X1 [Neoarius graeffei]|uniref:AP-1 complex subunit sigma-3b isoform X1 n=1 Tax=Neoarius graeffei TaxID=443677 RepID=UPI00298D43A3|nr:AP-1 complex subunit sigma-3b isoform X1 [Neoarius graeffei]